MYSIIVAILFAKRIPNLVTNEHIWIAEAKWVPLKDKKHLKIYSKDHSALLVGNDKKGNTISTNVRRSVRNFSCSCSAFARVFSLACFCEESYIRFCVVASVRVLGSPVSNESQTCKITDFTPSDLRMRRVIFQVMHSQAMAVHWVVKHSENWWLGLGLKV